MATLPTIFPTAPITVTVEPLTTSSFAPFGTVIVSPVPQELTTIPSQPPEAEQEPQRPRPQFANQQTALKTSPISPLTDDYPPSDANTKTRASQGLMSIFSCFPRQNVYTDRRDGKLKLKINILERHPFTTQTFCPFNYSESKDKTIGGRTFYLVVVAPTLKDETTSPLNPPDLSKIRAFLAPVTPDGQAGLAVTYGVATWHAPMVVLGERRVDFLVTQFANGTSEDDCQEVLVGDEARAVNVDLAGFGLEDAYLWRRARL